jgi:uncharacterized protein
LAGRLSKNKQQLAEIDVTKYYRMLYTDLFCNKGKEHGMSNQNNKLNGAFCWNELLTGNPTQARAFYEELFGWQATEIPVGEGIYTMFKSAGEDVAGMMKTPSDDIPPHWMSYIKVENITTALQRVEALKGTIRVPVTDIPGMGRFAVIVDPTGAQFAIWETASQ